MYQLLNSTPLKDLNTFGIDVYTNHFIKTDSHDGLLKAIGFSKEHNLPLLILGGGSNIIFTQNFPGVIIQPLFSGVELLHEDSQTVTLRVGAGVEWDSLVEHTVLNGWGGLENLSLIPGHVGASPIQNIGAYGVEAKDTICKVICVDMQNGNTLEMDTSQCEFGYRSSIFKTQLKGRVVITHVCYKLQKQPRFNTHYGSINDELQRLGETNLANVRQAVIDIRQSKLPDPKELGNAGSFFKNPSVPMAFIERLKSRFEGMPFYPIDDANAKLPAGWLIEQCGWKGKRTGKVGVHAQQALVLVNYGGATGQEVLALANAIVESVHEQFGVCLEMEVNVV